MKINVKEIAVNLENILKSNFEIYTKKFLDNYKKLNMEKTDRNPYVVFFRVGDDPASIVYMKAKDDYIKRIAPNIDVENIVLKSPSELPSKIMEKNDDLLCLGMLIQSPLPKSPENQGFNFYVEMIDPNKDLDRFHSYWVAKNTRTGEVKNEIDIEALPCTPRGIISLMKKIMNNGDLKGKSILIIGRSDIVTKPLVNACINSGMFVTNVSSTTPLETIENIMPNYDVVVSAIGVSKLINVKTKNFKNKTLLIDVGISRDENNKLSGDFNIDNMDDENVLFTPVPNGVGILTKLMLTSQICSNLIKYTSEIEVK